MTATTNEQQINSQREKVSQPNPKLNLISPCKIGNGILKLSENDWNYYNSSFKELSCKIGIFVPASGSGSRMFEFLFDFLSLLSYNFESCIFEGEISSKFVICRRKYKPSFFRVPK